MTGPAKHPAWQGPALITLSAAFFAVNAIAARFAVGHGPPVLLGFLRSTIAAITLVIITWPILYRYRAVLRRDWLKFFILGAFGTGFNATPAYMGAPTTTAVNISLVSCAGPVLIVLGSHFILRERVGLRGLFGTLLAIAGVLVIVFRGDLAEAQRLSISSGDLLVILGNASWAVYAVGLRRYPSALPPLPTLAVMTVGGAIVLLPFMLLERLIDGPLAADAAFYGIAVVAALCTGVVAFAAHAQASYIMGPSRAAMTMYLLPVFSVILAVLLLNETVALYHLVGGVMTLAGVWLASAPSAKTTQGES